MLPYPYDFISLVGFFVLMVYLRSRNEIKGSGGMEGIKNLFRFPSSPKPEHYSGPLKYYCMTCGKEHNEISCPNCGSKMKRVD
jgi:rubrerythrin